MTTPRLFSVLAMLALCGCVSMPKNESVAAAASGLPSAWRASNAGDDSAELARWWSNFADAQLHALIDKALVRNYDLKAAIERTRQARAQSIISRSSLYPELDVSASASRQRSHLPPPAGIASDVGVGVSGTWAVDIFGGNQLTALAAIAQAEATNEARRDFEVALIANVATAYIQLRGLQRQRAILDENVAVRADTLQLTQVRYRAGLASDLDVARAQTQLQQAQASVPGVQQQIDDHLGTLAVLSGDPPESIERKLREVSPIPPVSPALPHRAPGEVLERRPDLRQAARRIDAAAASLGAAKADLLPKFTLSFGGSIDRLAYRSMTPVTDHLFNLGLGIFWPLFNAGRIHANIAAHDAALREAEYAFDQALLNALQDVESAYTDVRAQRERSALLNLAVNSARRSSVLAQALYEAGEADFLSVLDAHTQLLDTERDLVQAQTDAAVGAVSLYRALGGGWQDIREETAGPRLSTEDRRPDDE